MNAGRLQGVILRAHRLQEISDVLYLFSVDLPNKNLDLLSNITPDMNIVQLIFRPSDLGVIEFEGFLDASLQRRYLTISLVNCFCIFLIELP